MNHKHLYSAIFVAALAGGAYAQGMNMPMNDKPAPAATKSGLPFVDAEVRKVDEKQGKVTLKHGDIPNLSMPPMTMVFDVADKKMLKGIKTGDKVRFQVDMISSKATVTAMEKAH